MLLYEARIGLRAVGRHREDDERGGDAAFENPETDSPSRTDASASSQGYGLNE
jgi:hypothetical protein